MKFNHKPAIWHPFTQHGMTQSIIPIARAKGVYLYPQDGSPPILDGISSWWINIHGHAHPAIVKAVQDQVSQLSQVIFAGFTHDKAENLTEKLLAFCGSNFYQHAFYSDSGSTSVEVALKMALGFWHNRNESRDKIIAIQHSYHGDTFGTMSTGARSVYNAIYNRLLFDVHHLPFPLGTGENTRAALKDYLNSNQAAAIILEPLVLGAGGMKMYDANLLNDIITIAKQNNILVIFDEVMTGFGRTGTPFAADKIKQYPDIICLSKGLTGGTLPIGVTLTTRHVYDAFYADDKSKMFFHSSSFSGNALSCAAALASLNIWHDEPVQTRINTMSAYHAQFVKRLNNNPYVQNARSCGTILAFEITHDHNGYLSPAATWFYDYFLKNKILLRPLGNTIYIMPPYTITTDELERIYNIIEKALIAYTS
jgi:adenosylmethionine-8-amino-7-oxononanoate aminotransferase